MKKKSAFILFYILIAFALPLIGNIELLFHYKILFAIFATVLLLTIQPRVDLFEAKEKKESDNNSAFIILICSLIGIIAPIIQWAYFTEQLNNSTLTMLGGLLLIIGIGIRTIAINTLGKYFTTIVQTTAQHQIVKKGMYAIIRHPSYLGTFISMIGIGIFLQVWVGTIISVISILIAYHFRIQAEEKELINSFGQDYIDYQNETQKMIPFIW